MNSMVRAFLLVLLSGAIYFWHQTRMPDVRPLIDAEIPEAREELARQFERAISSQHVAARRAPASSADDLAPVDTTQMAPVVVGGSNAIGASFPAGLPDSIRELEPRLYEDVQRSVNEINQVFLSLREDQIDERVYLLNLALRLGYDVAPQLVSLGLAELQVQGRMGTSSPMVPQRLEALRVGLRLVVYNSTDPEELKDLYRRVREMLPVPEVKDELVQVFPPDLIEQAEAGSF